MTFKFLRLTRIQEAWDYRSEPEAMRPLAVFFWRALLILALIVFLFALWFGIQELNAASQAESVPTTSSAPPPPLDTAQLQSTLDALTARQSDYQTLSQSPLPSVPDPSK